MTCSCDEDDYDPGVEEAKCMECERETAVGNLIRLGPNLYACDDCLDLHVGCHAGECDIARARA